MSLIDTLSHHVTQLDEAEIRRLLAATPEDVCCDPAYLEAVAVLDASLLRSTLPEARRVLREGLPGVVDHLNATYHLTAEPMSTYTLGNWLIGFVDDPSQMIMLMRIHRYVPRHVFIETLSDLLVLYAPMKQGGVLWQQAMATLAIPLLASPA